MLVYEHVDGNYNQPIFKTANSFYKCYVKFMLYVTKLIGEIAFNIDPMTSGCPASFHQFKKAAKCKHNTYKYLTAQASYTSMSQHTEHLRMVWV